VMWHKSQVERELERAKRELKKELDHIRAITEQDRAHRERFELCKKKLSDVSKTVETLHAMGADLEDSTNHMKVMSLTELVQSAHISFSLSCYFALNRGSCCLNPSRSQEHFQSGRSALNASRVPEAR